MTTTIEVDGRGRTSIPREYRTDGSQTYLVEQLPTGDLLWRRAQTLPIEEIKLLKNRAIEDAFEDVDNGRNVVDLDY